MLSLLLLLLGGAPEPAVTNPDWEVKPSSDDIEAFFPPEAVRQGVEGHVTLDCFVAVDHTLKNCTVVEETPPGLGFGDAALKMATRFRMKPMTVNGRAVGDGEVRVPIRFAMGGIGPAAFTPADLLEVETCFGYSQARIDQRWTPQARTAYDFWAHAYVRGMGWSGISTADSLARRETGRQAALAALRTKAGKAKSAQCLELGVARSGFSNWRESLPRVFAELPPKSPTAPQPFPLDQVERCVRAGMGWREEMPKPREVAEFSAVWTYALGAQLVAKRMKSQAITARMTKLLEEGRIHRRTAAADADRRQCLRLLADDARDRPR